MYKRSYTVEPPYNDQPRGNAFWPLYRGGFAEGFSSVQLKSPFNDKNSSCNYIVSSVHTLLFFLIVLMSSACLAELMLVKRKSISESICAPSVVAHRVSAFLSRSTNSRVAKVTGSKVNRGGGYMDLKFHASKHFMDKKLHR